MRLLPRDSADDAELIRRSLSEPETFAELFDRHAPRIHRFVARRLGDDAADDIVSETFLAAFRVRHRYDLSRSDAQPWLYGIAVRLIGKKRRAEVRKWRALARAGAERSSDGGLLDADARVSAGMAHAALAEAIARLAPRDRDVLLLIAWEDLSYEEVATALGVPIGTVRSRLSRARRQVRVALRADRFTPSTEELTYG